MRFFSFYLLVLLNINAFAASSRSGMVQIPGGTFQMGCGEECPMEDAKPVHPVTLDSFWMDETPVTNAAFAKFVEKTGYRTVAERVPKVADYPDVPKDKLLAGSAVFTPQDVGLLNPLAWWSFVPGAYWRKTESPNSKDADKELPDYPVIHVAYEDAESYCRWVKKDLPTEAQFEYAARGGLVGKKYAWGDDLKPKGKWASNIWQGKFPKDDTGEDGFRGVSPVRAFGKNGYGLYDVAGNVWQWCSDWYRPDTYAVRAKAAAKNINPQGPISSEDPSEPGAKKRVQRGGSFLCSDQYCTRYLVGSRGRGSFDSGASNLGFRCVQNQ